MEPSMDKKTARSSLRALSQLFDGPPGPGVVPPINAFAAENPI